MNVKQALENRKSVRAYTDKPVDEELIKDILRSAGKAPSGVNTQPWKVVVVSGKKKQHIQSRMEASFRSGERGTMDYQYYPLKWSEPYRGRRKACGLQMYSALGIRREDRRGQADQWAANYRAFDAPVMLFFYMDASFQTGSYIDYGMFLQSLMLAAAAEGLASCPQAALAEYPEIVKQELALSSDCILICGMALGYEDKSAAVNSYRTEREPIESWVRFET